MLGTDWSKLGPGYRSQTKAPGKGKLFNLGNEGSLLARFLPAACRAEPARGCEADGSPGNSVTGDVNEQFGFASAADIGAASPVPPHIM